MTLTSDLTQYYDNIKPELIMKAVEFEANGSRIFTTEKIIYTNLQFISRLEVNINKYNPARTSSYFSLGSENKDKKAIINIENNEQCCFT